MIIDSHCHLDFEDFKDDLDDVLQRARTAGVGIMLSIATEKKEYPYMIDLIEKHPFIYGAFGIHPGAVEAELLTPDEIVQMVSHPKILGIGETGLDYHYHPETKDVQIKSLRNHIEAARRTGLPLIIHTRDADDDLIKVIEDERKKGIFTGVLHCFSSSEKLALKAIEWGFYISFSGMITFKKLEDLRQIAKKVPVDRLLVETDAPFLAPIPYRGKRNEPAFVAYTFKQLAELKGMDEGEFAVILEQNFNTLFNKIKEK